MIRHGDVTPGEYTYKLCPGGNPDTQMQNSTSRSRQLNMNNRLGLLGSFGVIKNLKINEAFPSSRNKNGQKRKKTSCLLFSDAVAPQDM